MSEPLTKLIIFDCDGVLIDSEVISGKVLIGLLADLGVELDFAYVQKNFIGRSFQKVAAEIGDSFGLKLPQNFEAEYRAKLLKAFDTDLMPTNGIEQILKQLSLKSCVATSSSPERVTHSLRVTQLATYFSGNIFTASQVKNGKPAPDLFLFAAKNMGIDPKNCLVIEDSAPGVEAALNANMPVWHYAGGSHLKDMQLALKPNIKPDFTFSNWQELAQLLPHAFIN